jgi:predicted nucleic acid-binding protein
LPVIEQELTRVHALGLDVQPPSPGIDVDAARFARETKISVYDATYLALAASLRCDMVTADRKLIRSVKGRGEIRLLGASG